MKRIKAHIITWPKNKDGEPMFTCSEDAIFYAQMAVNDTGVIENLKFYREKLHRKIKVERARVNPNLDRMMLYATKGQYFRECWEEIERIRAEGK